MSYSQPDESLKVYDKFNELVKKYGFAKFSNLCSLCYNPESFYESN